MIYFKHLTFTLTLLYSMIVTTALGATHPLQAVKDQVELTLAHHLRPVVIFDIDDTLTDTKERNLRVLKNFVSQPFIKNQYPNEVQKILKLSKANIRYQLKDTLKEASILDAEFVTKASQFWLAHFFTNEYVAFDRPIEGASQYLHQLINKGAIIVYLTGRDIPRMKEGTIQNINHNLFPFSADTSFLFMKSDTSIDDLSFKKQSFDQIKKLGEVVAVFENEPANLNAMIQVFPNANAIFLDTTHSPLPDTPHTKAHTIKNYNYRLPYKVINQSEAQALACAEAKRVRFAFETFCEDDFYNPEQDLASYTFSSSDVSGDCDITVRVSKNSEEVKSSILCN